MLTDSTNTIPKSGNNQVALIQDHRTTKNDVNCSDLDPKKELLNNAILFYQNYNKIKLDLLNTDLIKPYMTGPQPSDSMVISKTSEIDSIINMKSPMPSLTWANNNDLWKVMRLKDLQYKHDFNYLRRHAGIEPQMRSILIDWLVEIAYAYRLHRETLHLAIEYMDRFMTLSKHQMRVDRLQLIGISSLFLAAKVEEIYPPKLKDFASHMESYCSNNEDAIQQFELFMLKTLNWQISPVTANTWLMTYLQIASINYYKFVVNAAGAGDKENKPRYLKYTFFHFSNLLAHVQYTVVSYTTFSLPKAKIFNFSNPTIFFFLY